MRQGSFMYCEKNTFVYFVILPLNTTLEVMLHLPL